MLEKAGFVDVRMVAETGFDSSPKTKGVLVRATRAGEAVDGKDGAPEDLLGRYQAFFDQTYAQGVLDRKTKHLIALGASLAAGCEA